MTALLAGWYYSPLVSLAVIEVVPDVTRVSASGRALVIRVHCCPQQVSHSVTEVWRDQDVGFWHHHCFGLHRGPVHAREGLEKTWSLIWLDSSFKILSSMLGRGCSCDGNSEDEIDLVLLAVSEAGSAEGCIEVVVLFGFGFGEMATGSPFLFCWTQ